MTGRDLQWGEDNVPFGALNEAGDPRVLPPGQCSEVLNCTYSAKAGKVQKRPGTALAMASVATSNANRLVVHGQKNQLLLVDLEGTDGTAPSLYAALDAPVDGDTTMVERHVGNATNVLVERQPVVTDLHGDVAADCAYVATGGDFGYMVYAACQARTGNVVIKVVQVPKVGTNLAPGNAVIEQNVEYVTEGGLFKWVRCAPAQDNYVLVTMAQDTGANSVDIYAIVVDCTASPIPTVGTLTSIVTGVTGLNGTFDMYANDACESTYDTDLGAGVPNWIVCWRTATDAVVRRLYSTSLTTSWTATIASTNTHALSCFEYGGDVWLNWWEGGGPAWKYAVLSTATGGITLAKTTWCFAADIGTADILAEGWISGICRHETTGQAVLFHSQNYDQWGSIVSGFDDRSTVRWRVADTAAGLSALRQKRGPWLLSKPWKDRNNGFYLAWCMYDSVRERTELDGTTTGVSPNGCKYDMTPVLMRFTEPPAEEGADPPTASMAPTAQVISTIAGYRGVEPTFPTSGASFANYPMRLAELPASVTHGTRDTADTSVQQVGRRTCISLRYVPTEAIGDAWDVCVRDNESSDFRAGFGRYAAASFGASTYLAGGLLTQWDGGRHHENNFVAQPTLGLYNVTSGGTWGVEWAEKLFHAQAVWETVGEGGERTRSATSAVVSIRLNGDAALGTAPTNTLTFYLEPNTVTMRTFGSAQELQTPRTLVALYASMAPDATDLHRIYEFGHVGWSDFVSEPDATGPLVVTVTSWPPSSDASANEIIYNDSGELDNDPPYGGCSTLTVHKDRLWVGAGDERDLLWYSKERVDGRPAEFALGQQVRLPGATVVGLDSLDDALIVRCREGIYAIYGDGPNATGDPASGFFQVVPISTSVGCVDSAAAVTPKGLLFASHSGLMLLTRGRTVEPVGNVNSSITARPVATTHTQQADAQVRFILANTAAMDGAGAYNADVLVYDWEADRFATWRYSLNDHSLEPPAGLIADVKTLNGRTYILTDDGRILREDATLGADATYVYRQKLTFGWLDFGRPNGEKRVRHWQALLQPPTWATYTADPSLFPFGLKVSFDFNHAESGTTLTRYWVNYTLGQTAAWDGITKVRCHLSKKQPAVRVTLEEDEPSRRLIATDTAASVALSGNTTLRLRIESGAGYSNLVVTDGTRTKAEIAADLNTAIAALGWTDYVQVTVEGANQIYIQIIGKESALGYGSFLAVDSVANGSTLNSVIGFPAGATVGSYTVSAAAQVGFAGQGHSFEVGQAPGLRRTAAAQSK